MFFDSVVVIWGIFVCFSCGFFCFCLPRKFMGLKARVCFAGDIAMLEIWVWRLVEIWVWGWVLCWRLITGKNKKE